MYRCPSPFENLSAFAIAFFSGALSVLGVASYLESLRREHRKEASPERADEPR